MKTIEKSKIAFILIILIYCLYAGLFIYRTSFVINGERFFSLFDDAMISMRYAKNLANGYGLVWNPAGERVEGYTNPLWTLYMAIFHLFPIAQSKISIFIQISGALFLIVNLFFVKKIADLISDGSTVVSLLAVFLTAFYLPLNNWSLQGMEVSVLTLIISISIWKTLQCIKLNGFSIWLYILLGVGTLIRIDMAVPFLAILIFMLMADPKNRSKNLVWGLLVFIFFILIQTVFRIWYFGDILPNTYYLKMTGYPFFLRISRGLYVLLNFIYKLNWILFLLPFSILLFRRDKLILLLFWAFLTQIMYSVYVGGDAWEWWGNRYLCIVMPVFFILFCCSLRKIGSSLITKIGERRSLIEKYAKYGFIAFVFISLPNFNSIYDHCGLGEWLLINSPLHVLDNKTMVKKAFLLTKITNARAKIAVVWAGAIPYFSDRYTIDLLGKNDKKIASEKMRVSSGLSKFIDFYPGHLKWNYSYSIGKLKPDVVVQLWGFKEAKPYLEDNYIKVKLQGFTLYLLKESNNVLWDKIKSVE